MRVIGFSLWGSEARYVAGALANTALVPRVYPGWRARFYVAPDVPASIRDSLADEPHVDVVRMPACEGWLGTLWRFQVALDPAVDVMISRDCDSRVSERERSAVDAWLADGTRAHIMRDHPWHDVPMLGGMWGLRRGAVPSLDRALAAWHGPDAHGTDQTFLAEHVYPAVVGDATIHASFHADEKRARGFPTPRRGTEFVGSVCDAAGRPNEKQERALRRGLKRIVR